MARVTARAAGLGQGGFTLAELLVAVAIVGLVMAGLVTLLMTGNQSYVTGANQVEAQQAGRVALERVAQEVRQAGLNPQGVTTFYPIVGSGTCPNSNAPTAAAFMIQSDGNGNGSIQGTECILYTLSGTNLQRQDFSVDASPQTIIGGVQSLSFSYWQEDGQQIDPVTVAEIPNIRSIGIDIITQPENQPAIWQGGRVTVRMIDRVRLRNR